MKRNLFSFMLALLAVGAMLVTGCKKYDDDISATNKDVANLKAELYALDDSLTTEIEYLQGEIDVLEAQIWAISDTGKSGLIKELFVLYYELEMDKADKATVDSLKTLVENNAAKITEIESQIRGIRGSLDDLATAVEKKADASTVTALETKLSNISNALDEAKKNIDALGKKDEDLQKQINSLTTDVDELKRQVKGYVSAEAFNELKARVDTIESQIKGLTNVAKALKDVAFIPQTLFDGLGVITFDRSFIMYNNGDPRFYPSSKMVPVTSSAAYLGYRVSPSNAAIDRSKLENFKFIVRNVTTLPTRATGDYDNLITIDEIVESKSTDELVVKARTSLEPNKLAVAGKNTIAAFQVTSEYGGEKVTSDYSYVSVGEPVADYHLAHEDATLDFPYREGFIDITEEPDDTLYEASGVCTPQLPYNGTLDLKDYVVACTGNGNPGTTKTTLQSALQAKEGDITYKFQFAGDNNEFAESGKDAPYIGKDGYTNQNRFVTMTSDGIMKVDEEFAPTGRPAIGRTPQVYVQAFYKGAFVTSAFIKVEVVEKTVTPEVKGIHVFLTHDVTFKFENLTNMGKSSDPEMTPNDSLAATWEEINTIVLGQLGITFEEFNDRYNLQDNDIMVVDSIYNQTTRKWEYTYTPINQSTPRPLPVGVTHTSEAPSEWKTSTNILSLLVDEQVEPESQEQITVAYMAKNNRADVNVAINFRYTITKPETHVHTFVLPELALNPDYLLGDMDRIKCDVNRPEESFNPAPYNEWAGVRVKGRPNLPFNSAIIEHFKNYTIKTLAGATLEEGATLKFKIEYYTDDQFTFIKVTGAEVGTIGRENGHSVLVLTKSEIDALNAGTATSPDISYVGTSQLFGTNANVLVSVTENCSKQYVEGDKSKTGYYYVVYNTINMKINVKDFSLRTLSDKADSVDIQTLVTFTDASDKIMFEFDATTENTWKPTPYAEETYHIPSTTTIQVRVKEGLASKAITYPYDSKESFGDCLFMNPIGGADPANRYVIWDNKGTELQYDKYAQLNLEYIVNSETPKPTNASKITVLSSAHSK